MKLCDDSITVYNNYTTSDTKVKVYIPTVIKNIHWYGTVEVDVTPSGLIDASRYTIRIPDGQADFGGSQYVSPKTYEKLSDKTGYFTLRKGDTIVHGEVVEHGDNARPSKLAEEYDDVVTIISVTDNRRAPNEPHFRVVCK